jgi:hypothetical protein
MPKPRPTVCSFWVYRPVEHPNAFDYPVLLRILQASCDRLGLRHLVLTDHATLASERWPDGIEGWATELPAPLMQACTEVQARYLESAPDHDTLFVGADCIILRDPAKAVTRDADLCVTYRHSGARYPVNNGFMYVNRRSIDKVAALYRRVADRCGAKWCDDQRALIAELSPMPIGCGLQVRAGLSVSFMPMGRFNSLPRTVEDPAIGAVALHFRGKQHATGQHRKDLMVDWAKRHGFAA